MTTPTTPSTQIDPASVRSELRRLSNILGASPLEHLRGDPAKEMRTLPLNLLKTAESSSDRIGMALAFIISSEARSRSGWCQPQVGFPPTLVMTTPAFHQAFSQDPDARHVSEQLGLRFAFQESGQPDPARGSLDIFGLDGPAAERKLKIFGVECGSRIILDRRITDQPAAPATT